MTFPGHWFHFAERILPMLNPAYDRVWGPGGMVASELRDEIYLVFAEASSAKTLGPFGRFFLTSVLTGGSFKTVHICSATSILYNSLGSDEVANARSLVKDLKIHFTIDLRLQDVRDLFIKNARSDIHGNGKVHLCAKTLLKVPLIGYRRMFHWFTEYENVTKFRDSYAKMCDVSYPPNEMYSKLRNRREMSSSNYNMNFDHVTSSPDNKSSNRFEAQFISQGVTHVNRVDENKHGSRDDASRKRRYLAAQSEFMKGNNTDSNMSNRSATDSGSSSSSSSSSRGRRVSNIHTTDDVTTEEYFTELVLPGIKDDLEVVRDHGGLRKDPSAYNPFFMNISHSYLKIEIPPLHVVHKTGRQKLLIYQRDASRKMRGIDQFVENLRNQLSTDSSAIERSAAWEVDLYSHRENGSPCELVRKLSQTSAFVTAHGFQSFLLIYLPNTALVVEVFPALYYIPTYYGELQLTYRARFGFQRSYLSHESDTMSNLIHYSSKLIWGNTKWCRHYFLCRHVARSQDVKVSDDFMKTIASFLKHNFRR